MKIKNEKNHFLERSNINQKSIKKKFKKIQNYFHTGSNSDILNKFFSAFGLENCYYDESLEKALKLHNQLGELLKKERYTKFKIQIMYILKHLRYYSFSQIAEKLQISDKILAELLKELRDSNHIKLASNLSPDITELNEILRFKKEGKKNKFYTFNYENPNANDILDQADKLSLISNSLKTDIATESDYLIRSRKEYQQDKLRLAELSEIKKKNKLTKLDKIRFELVCLAKNQGKWAFNPNELLMYLRDTKELITDYKWLGKKNEYGNYSKGLKNTMIKYAFIREIADKQGNPLIKIMPRCDPNYSFIKSEKEKLESDDEGLKLLDSLKNEIKK